MPRPNGVMTKFRVYEIEHSGDEAASLADLRKAGFEKVSVLARDYEGSESIVVEATVPAGKSFNELVAKLEHVIT